jgi:TatD DNase family protein
VSHWSDAHCHLQEQFLGDEETTAKLNDTLARAHDGGVDRVVVIGTDATTSAQALEIADVDSPVEIYATVGLHPHDAAHDIGPVLDLARRGHPKLVGIGECGLDYYYEHSPRADQRRAFAAQIALAHELDLALVIHAREAFDDLFELLTSEGVPERTVVHCFTGTTEDAQAALALGCDISVSGIVTFKSAEVLREAVRSVPLDRLHVETDSPFLAPVPYRGKANEPAFVTVVGEFVAELRGESFVEVREATSANTARLFRLPPR